MSQAGIDKSAALLLALGEEATAAVFRFLSPLEVSRLGSAMRELEVLPRDRVRAILHHYAAEAAEQKQDVAMVGGGARDVGLVRAFKEITGHDILVPARPHLTAALGAALIAMEGLRPSA